jgi:4-hydroxybenzoate polyprenyltransferase
VKTEFCAGSPSIGITFEPDKMTWIGAALNGVGYLVLLHLFHAFSILLPICIAFLMVKYRLKHSTKEVGSV